jgi:hypothetical protein
MATTAAPVPPEPVRNASASRVVVWFALHAHQPASFGDLTRVTGRADSCVAGALASLIEAGVVEKQPSDDGRIPLYTLASD